MAPKVERNGIETKMEAPEVAEEEDKQKNSMLHHLMSMGFSQQLSSTALRATSFQSIHH